jgi:hypothetical protein
MASYFSYPFNYDIWRGRAHTKQSLLVERSTAAFTWSTVFSRWKMRSSLSIRVMDRSSLSTTFNVHIALILVLASCIFLLGAPAVNRGGESPEIIWSHPIAQSSACIGSCNPPMNHSALVLSRLFHPPPFFYLGRISASTKTVMIPVRQLRIIARYRFAGARSITAGAVWNGVTAWRETGGLASERAAGRASCTLGARRFAQADEQVCDFSLCRTFLLCRGPCSYCSLPCWAVPFLIMLENYCKKCVPQVSRLWLCLTTTSN